MIRFYGHKNEYGFLSNFYPSPINVHGVRAQNVEAYFQAMKTLDPDEREAILRAPTPGEAKRLGSRCTLREDWNTVVGTEALQAYFQDDKGIVVELTKDHLMYTALIVKFSIAELRDSLLATAPHELVENAPTDPYWGIGDGTGLNKLGRMLMLVRATMIRNSQRYGDP